MPRTVCARGCRGASVEDLQTALSKHGLYTGRLDGVYGGGTERGVRAYQTLAALAETGIADEVTWRGCTGLPMPPLARRCIQLTAAIEGHGFGMVAGNFDGAGLTWGIIGFTLKSGSLRDVILSVHAEHPEAVATAFGPLAGALLENVSLGFHQARAWADSISVGPNRYAVREEWRDAFARFGADPVVRRTQIDVAMSGYYEPAVTTAERLELTTELGIALAFDVQVQNGGIKDEATDLLLEEKARGAVLSQRELRLRIAELVSESANSRWRDDVLARKTAIASGRGMVHGELFVLESWGLGEYAL